MLNILDHALKFLSYRPRSQKEINDFLHKKTQDETLINQTIDKLKELKLIDDEEFGRWLIASRSRSKPRGVRLLKHELKQMGVEAEVEVDEDELAQQALEKKRPKSRDQAIRFLQYRGFSWDAIAQAIKKVYNEHHVK